MDGLKPLNNLATDLFRLVSDMPPSKRKPTAANTPSEAPSKRGKVAEEVPINTLLARLKRDELEALLAEAVTSGCASQI